MRLINIPDLSPANDDFTQLELGDGATWLGLSGLPQNKLEQRVNKIRLARYRGALEAAAAAQPLDVVVSHLPAMSTAVSYALRLLRKENRHLAFAFNYTNLPEGVRREAMKRAAANIDKFIVFSQYEIDLYSQHFDIPRERIEYLIWTQDKPPVSGLQFYSRRSGYFCAVGGEGRDIDLIIECAKNGFSDVEFVIITRPHLIPRMNLPDNITFLTNIPLADTWSIAAESIAVLIPLDNETRCCGHITLVSAKLMGIPIVTTESLATKEYTEGRESILISRAGDVNGFSANLRKAIYENQILKRNAVNAIPSESKFHSRSKWKEFLKGYVSLA